MKSREIQEGATHNPRREHMTGWERLVAYRVLEQMAAGEPVAAVAADEAEQLFWGLLDSNASRRAALGIYSATTGEGLDD